MKFVKMSIKVFLNILMQLDEFKSVLGAVHQLLLSGVGCMQQCGPGDVKIL
jgi:hypothetical protein